MANTHFANSNGLPHPQHYSTAQDLAILAAAITRDFPEYYGYYSQKEYRYNKIAQPNRNRLLWLDPSVDGVKTGHTDAAGFCLIGSANRGGRRLLSVFLGGLSENSRAQESLKLLNWGYQFFDSVKLYAANVPVRSLPVWKGASRDVKVGVSRDLLVAVPKGEADKLKAELVSQQPLLAPLSQGQRVGTLRVSFDGKPLGEYPLVALQAVGTAGIFGRAWDTLRLWLK
jgi:D-alanyl-D-alanine carboxypeptidase (penicillin-binding protein 5/6)